MKYTLIRELKKAVDISLDIGLTPVLSSQYGILGFSEGLYLKNC